VLKTEPQFLPLLALAISGYASVVEREGRHFVQPRKVSEASPSHLAGCQSQPLKPLSIPDIFVPLDKSEPDFPKASPHTVQPVGLSGKRPTPTTNFFTNFILGDQSKPVFCHPYTLTWSGCAQEACHYGIGVVHTDSSDFQFARGDPTPYYYSDNDKHQIVLSAAELGPTTVLTTESFKAASITIGLAPQKQGVVVMRIPVVQGMGLVTAEYINGTPRIQSLVGISELIPESVSGETGLFRYRAVLVDGAEWMIYIRPTGTTTRPEFTKDNANTFTATKSGFKGIIQIGKAPMGLDVTSIYDQTAGAYPTGVSITGSVEKDHGSYSIAWEKAGDAKKTLLMFALPHHVSSFTEQTRQKLTNSASEPRPRVQLGLCWRMG
jgi:endo-1,3(4)-beta-glucanase